MNGASVAGTLPHAAGHHTYSVYGMTLCSELELPGLRAGLGAAEAVIRCGVVPDELPAAAQRGVVFQVAADQLLIRDPVAGWKFLVVGGREVIVQHGGRIDDPDLRIYLIVAGLGGLVAQRGLFPLHASAVEVDGRAILFAGVSGAGKSSLVQELMQRGHRLLTDDLSPLEVSGDGISVRPGFPRLKLWPDRLESADDAGQFVVGGRTRRLERVRRDLPKYVLPIDEGAFCDRTLPLGAVYILESEQGDVVELAPLSGVARLQALLEHQFGSESLSVTALAGTGVVMQLAARLANVQVVRVRRPESADSLEDSVRSLADRVEADLEQRCFTTATLPSQEGT